MRGLVIAWTVAVGVAIVALLLLLWSANRDLADIHNERIERRIVLEEPAVVWVKGRCPVTIKPWEMSE